jgi:hypothetical protein
MVRFCFVGRYKSTLAVPIHRGIESESNSENSFYGHVIQFRLGPADSALRVSIRHTTEDQPFRNPRNLQTRHATCESERSNFEERVSLNPTSITPFHSSNTPIMSSSNTHFFFPTSSISLKGKTLVVVRALLNNDIKH